MVPAAEPQPRWTFDVELGGRFAVEHPVDINPARAVPVGVHHVHPLVGRQAALGLDIGKIAVDVDVRRAAKLHPHFAATVASFISPSDNGPVRLLRAKPKRGGVRAVPRRVVGNLVSAEHALLPREMPSHPDHSGHGGGALVLGLECADLIPHLVAQMPNTQVAVRFAEHRLAIGFARCVGLAPMQFEFLPRVPMDRRNLDPDAGFPLRRVPVLDLIGKGLSINREPDVLTAGFRFAEIKEVFVQSHQQREPLDRRPIGQISTLRCGQDGDRASVLPTRHLLRGDGKGER